MQIHRKRKTWMPLRKWEDLVRGKGCPLCLVIKSKSESDDYGFNIANLKMGKLRLVRNQFVNGYCVLICNLHVKEPYSLTKNQRTYFFEDMMTAGMALEKVFSPIKMNFEILGNAIPHLHCHIIPRYYGDSAPGSPINVDSKIIYLSERDYLDRIKAIRNAL